MILKNLAVGVIVFGVAATSFAESLVAHIEMKPVGVQRETWSSGPNAATRVLRHLGSTVGLDEVVRASHKSVDMQPYMVEGPNPTDLMNQMNGLTQAAQFTARTDLILEDAINEVIQGRPVILLIKTAEKGMPSWKLARAAAFFKGGLAKVINQTPFARQYGLTFTQNEIPNSLEVPVLHYVTLNGWSSSTGQFSYVDSDERQKQISYSELLAKWDWVAKSAFVQKILRAVNVTGKTMITYRLPVVVAPVAEEVLVAPVELLPPVEVVSPVVEVAGPCEVAPEPTLPPVTVDEVAPIASTAELETSTPVEVEAVESPRTEDVKEGASALTLHQGLAMIEEISIRVEIPQERVNEIQAVAQQWFSRIF